MTVNSAAIAFSKFTLGRTAAIRSPYLLCDVQMRIRADVGHFLMGARWYFYRRVNGKERGGAREAANDMAARCLLD